MRKLLTCLFAITMIAPFSYNANGAISRALPTGAKQSDVARTVSTRTATRDVSRTGNTSDAKVRSTVSRVVASSVPNSSCNLFH